MERSGAGLVENEQDRIRDELAQAEAVFRRGAGARNSIEWRSAVSLPVPFIAEQARVRVELAVDPAISQGGLDGLGLAQGRLTRPLLGEGQPHAGRGGPVLRKPTPPSRPGGQTENRQSLVGGRSLTFLAEVAVPHADHLA